MKKMLFYYQVDVGAALLLGILNINNAHYRDVKFFSITWKICGRLDERILCVFE